MARSGTGAGAATAAGVGYQDRIAGYFITCALVGHAPAAVGGVALQKISFETLNEIDDFLVERTDGSAWFLQAKRKLTYSNAADSELQTTLKQFLKQYFADRDTKSPPSSYALVTTGDSSKKITRDLKVTLDGMPLVVDPLVSSGEVLELLSGVQIVDQNNLPIGR